MDCEVEFEIHVKKIFTITDDEMISIINENGFPKRIKKSMFDISYIDIDNIYATIYNENTHEYEYQGYIV